LPQKRWQSEHTDVEGQSVGRWEEDLSPNPWYEGAARLPALPYGGSYDLPVATDLARA